MFIEKLEELMKEKNVKNLKELSTLTLIPYTTIRSFYDNGTAGIRATTIMKLSDFFGCTSDYLINDDIPMGHLLYKNGITKHEYESWGEEFKSKDTRLVFVYGTIPAGIPVECIEEIIDTEELSVDMLKGNKKYFGLKIKGDSMSPEYLNNDTIILEKVEDCESGQDCVVMVNGNDGTFKRVIKNENGIILQPLNTNYSPIVFTNEQIENLPVKVIGVVVELRRKK